jgi:hypothetical protein
MIALVVGGAGSGLAQNPIFQVIHNSPSSGVAVVDIYLNAGASPDIDDLEFRHTTNLIDVPVGSYTFGIAPGNSSGPGDIIESFGPVNLQEGSRTVVMAAGELNDDFGLFYNGLNSGAPNNQVGLLTFHGSPDTPTVDIIATGEGILFDDLGYLDFQGYVNVEEANYVLTVAETDGNPIDSFNLPLMGMDGEAMVIFVSGYQDATPNFGLFAAYTNGVVIELTTTTPNESSSWSDIKARYW